MTREPRTSLGAVLTPSQVEPGTIPGFGPSDRLKLNIRARELVAEALAEGRNMAHAVLHVQPSGVTIENRTALAGSFRKFGVRGTAKKLEHACVPLGCVLVLVDADEVHLTTVPVSRLIDE